MWKMVVSIVVVAALLAGARFVKLGELTFAEHLARIARTPEAQELGDGIVATVSSAKTKVRSRINARLAATRNPSTGEFDPADFEEEPVIEDEELADEEPADEPEEPRSWRRSLFGN